MPRTMNLSGKLYQPLALQAIRETDWEKGNRGPLVVEMDTTAVCDLACPGCISEDLVMLGNSFSDEQLMRIANEFIEIGVKAVILIGGGEPLAHRKSGDFMRLLGENDIHIGITTNGSFIHKHLDVIAKYAKWTRVSMDAATEEKFQILRPTKGGKSKWDLITKNMRMLAEVKTGKLGFSFLIQTPADGPGIVSNIDEIYDAAVLARDLGCDYYEVKPTYQFREGVDHALMKHDPGLMELAAREVRRLDELETESFKILKAINLQYSLAGVDKDQPKDYHQCPSTHLRTTVTPTGVFVCPYWRGKDQMQIGHAKEESIQDLWHGERRKEVMERLDPSKDCNFHCLRHDTNLTAFQLKDLYDMGASVISVDEFDRFI